MEIHFVLVKPALPDNVGSAARAMNTMGFRHLRLVSPCDHLCRRARVLAHKSEGILEKAAVFQTLTDALKDMDFSVATTARKRHMHAPGPVALPELPLLLKERESGVRNMALVFGAEDSGLLNEELDVCDLVTYIPMAGPQPSLNLAQAVMVCAYALSGFAFAAPARGAAPKAAPQEYAALAHRVERFFDGLALPKEGLFRRKARKRFAQLSKDDMKLLHYLMSRIPCERSV